MTTTELAAAVVAILLAAVAVFQAALAAGAPWRHLSYGGRAGIDRGPLPAPFRVMSVGAAVILAISGWLVLARAGLVSGGPVGSGALTVAAWVIFAYLVLNTVMNLASSSPVERFGFGAVTLVAAVGCLIVAASGSGSG